MVKRRQVIASGCSGIASIGLLGVTSAEQEDGINTKFDPDREEELYKFLKKFDDLESVDHQGDVFVDLTDEQQKAMNEVREPESLVAEFDVVDTEVGIQSTSYNYEHTVTMRQVVTGSVYYRFHHRLTWDGDGDEVSNYDSEGWATDIAFGYLDGGNNTSWFDEHTTSRWINSYRQREMEYGGDIPGVSVVSYYPHSELRGTEVGDRFLMDEDDGV